MDQFRRNYCLFIGFFVLLFSAEVSSGNLTALKFPQSVIGSSTEYFFRTDSAALYTKPCFRFRLDSASSGYSFYAESVPITDSLLWIRFYVNVRNIKLVSAKDTLLPNLVGISFFEKTQQFEPHYIISMRLHPCTNNESRLVFNFRPRVDSFIVIPIEDVLANSQYHSVELLCSFSANRLSCTFYLDGKQKDSTSFKYLYSRNKLTISVGKLSFFSACPIELDAIISDFAVSNERIPPIPNAPTGCFHLVNGSTVVLNSAPYVSINPTDIIAASRYTLFTPHSYDNPIFDIVTDNEAFLYKCEVPFGLDSGQYLWRSAFKNSGNVWSKWSDIDTINVNSVRNHALKIESCFVAKQGRSSPVVSLKSGEWYDLYANYNVLYESDTMAFYFLAWLRNEKAMGGNFFNKGGSFDPEKNFILNVSFDPKNRIYRIFERSDSGSINSKIIEYGGEGVLVSGRTDETYVDFDRRKIRVRFKVPEKALAGRWFANLYAVDQLDERSNVVSIKMQVVPPAKISMRFIVLANICGVVLIAIILSVFVIRTRVKNSRLKDGTYESNKAREKLVAYIALNIEKKITVEQTMFDLGLGKRAFLRLVKEAEIDTFTKLVNKVKIDKAKELLKEDKSVLEVGISLGFDSPSYFAKVFKDTEGVPPKEYQQTNLK